MSETKMNPEFAPPAYQPGQGPPQPYPPSQPYPPQPYVQQPQYPPPQNPAYPPQQYPQHPVHVTQQPGPSGTVVIQQPVVVVGGAVGDVPMSTTCPNCRNTIVTAVSYEIGLLCWLIVGILCIIGCWPCCLIPFCVDSCKDAQHSCPSCHTVVGRYKRM